MPITIERKKELLKIVHDIGMPLTTLEAELHFEGIGREQVEKLKHALEVVRSIIVVHPERVN